VTRALVLRARDDAARTAEKLRAMGIDPVLSPVLEIAATDAPIPPGDYDAVLASSAKGLECAPVAARAFQNLPLHAVGAKTATTARASAKGLECAPVAARAFQNLPLHAVGAKTAATARALGWRPGIVAGSAEAILPLLLGHFTSPVKLLYLAGRDRQPALEAGLRAGGHAITVVNVYEARAAETLTEEARVAIEAEIIDLALHYSRRSVDILLRLVASAGLSPKLRAMDHVALSAEVARPLLAAGITPTVAEKPDEAGLLAAAREILRCP
jgi:uroporphyrinogen-III synthase